MNHTYLNSFFRAVQKDNSAEACRALYALEAKGFMSRRESIEAIIFWFRKQ